MELRLLLLLTMPFAMCLVMIANSCIAIYPEVMMSDMELAVIALKMPS